MSSSRSADARLERLFHVLPASMRERGASLTELADALETTPQRILEDLDELTTRAYYQPGGWPDDVQILIEAGRLRVYRADGFERPVRLTRDETLCLALALRGATASAQLPDREDRSALLGRAEMHLSANGTAEGGSLPRDAAAPGDRSPPFAAPDRNPDPEGIRETLLHGARERRPCAMWYVKAGARDGSVRVVHPYAIAYGEGAWYAVAHCTVEKDVRVFRMDRVLAADAADGTFEVPDDFDVADYVEGGRVYRAGEQAEVRVRYSARIARWVKERAEWEMDRMEETPAGDVVVVRRVADPSWAVGHVLLYGAEAEILGPPEVRGLVRDALEGVAGTI